MYPTNPFNRRRPAYLIIDWANPITSGLSHAVVGASFADLGGKALVSVVNPANIFPSEHSDGRAWRFTGTANTDKLVFPANALLAANGPSTRVCCLNPTVLSLGSHSDTTNSVTPSGYCIRSQGSGVLDIIESGIAVRASSTGALTAGKTQTYGVAFNTSGGAYQFFIDGIDAGGGTGTGFTPQVGSDHFGSNLDAQQFTGYLFLHLAWNARFLRNAELASITANPWQVFLATPSRRRAFAVAVAVTPARGELFDADLNIKTWFDADLQVAGWFDDDLVVAAKNAAFASAGAGAASGVSASINSQPGSSAGVGAASGVGASQSAQLGSAAGTSACAGVGASLANSIGNAGNLLTHPEEFDDASWDKVLTTIVPDAAAAPDGTRTADKAVEDSGSFGQHQVNWKNYAFQPYTTYTFSVHAAPAVNDDAIWLSPTNDVGDIGYARFDVALGTVVDSGAGSTPAITSAGNGFYRCSIEFNTGDLSGFSPPLWAQIGITGSPSYPFGGTGNDIDSVYLWGSQLDIGSLQAYHPGSTAKAIGAAVLAAAGSAVGTSTCSAVAGFTGSSTGTSTCSAVGASTAAADGNSSGTSTVSGIGASSAAATASSAGTGTALAIAGETASSSGTGTVSGVGASLNSQAGSAAGTGTATGVGASTAAATASAAGVGAATGVGASTADAIGSASGAASVSAIAGETASSTGTSSASGVGASLAAGVGSSSGSATVYGQAGSTASSAGVSTVSGVGTSLSSQVGNSTGTGSATGVGASLAAATAASDGVGTALGVGASLAAAVGSASGSADAQGNSGNKGAASGTGTATGVGAALADGVGSSSGVGSVDGVGVHLDSQAGSAAGTGTATGVGASTNAADGSSSGVGSAIGVGASLAAGVGSASGTSNVDGRYAFGGVGSSDGTSTATGVGAALAAALGSSAGTSSCASTGFAASSLHPDADIVIGTWLSNIPGPLFEAVNEDVLDREDFIYSPATGTNVCRLHFQPFPTPPDPSNCAIVYDIATPQPGMTITVKLYSGTTLIDQWMHTDGEGTFEHSFDGTGADFADLNVELIAA